MMYYFVYHLLAFVWLLALRLDIALHLQLNGCIWDFTIIPLDLFIIFEDPAADYSWEKTTWR